MSLRSICVFCGASPGARPIYRQSAENLGRHLAEQGLRLVYGGGAVGLMGVVADAAMAAGGEVIGIIPQSLERAEIGHLGLSRLEVVDGMHARKARMSSLLFIAYRAAPQARRHDVWKKGPSHLSRQPLAFAIVETVFLGATKDPHPEEASKRPSRRTRKPLDTSRPPASRRALRRSSA